MKGCGRVRASAIIDEDDGGNEQQRTAGFKPAYYQTASGGSGARWAGESELVRVYFSRPRTRQEDIRWLTLPAARELGTASRQLGEARVPRAAGKIRSDQDFLQAKKIIEEKARAHLRLRNETFGYPLTERRMEEIDAGIGIEPLPVDYLGGSPVSPYSA